MTKIKAFCVVKLVLSQTFVIAQSNLFNQAYGVQSDVNINEMKICNNLE
jgi:hypothetical protein